MKNLPPYRRPHRNTQPEYLFPAYASTVKRAPGLLFLRFLFRGISRAGASGGLMANQRLPADNPMKL